MTSATELVSVTYIWRENHVPIAFFSVSNDSISRDKCPRSAFERIQRLLAREKRYSSLPAVKIGRIGVSNACRRSGCGSRILEFLKIWFTTQNKTGCRFIVVDAYNDEERIGFYQRNGFTFLTEADKNDKTRIMYFDLLPFFNAQKAANSSS